MARPRNVLAIAALAAVAMSAAPAVAMADDDYLDLLHDRYTFLTYEQLVAASDKACDLTHAGSISPTTVSIIREDLGVSTGAALDIVAGAVVNQC